ncbi:MAG: hypothetical protein KDC43_10585 [Saprospiraceae bacterium]|nr:hypothetical protein [Saprospiraceae bacterium]MCB0624335.1 hypothetical protein [Saprospiraceae bacterium]MCB0678651.1 hypothetical protein [Saprospiraceae bacterium]MCB0683449.1 hypothetical protein [Saprospiraceae bacterium]
MKHFNNTAAVNLNQQTNVRKGKGKESLVLLILGIIGVAGLVYVLNASSGKSAFSENQAPNTEYTVAASSNGSTANW